MALGDTQLNNINYTQNMMRDNCKAMQECWQTFRYVVKSLSDWEADTVIGTEVTNDMKVLSGCLQDTLSGINELNDVIDKFVARQRELNK